MENAQLLYEKADKKLKGGWTTIFVPKNDRYEEAAELFERAGNLFKISNQWELAANSFEKAVECVLLANSFETSRCRLAAANCYRNCKRTDKVVSCYLGLSEEAQNAGNFKQSARHLREIAEIYEREHDALNALDFYQKAGDIYQTEGDVGQMVKCMLKVADYFTLDTVGKYREAIKIYEKIAEVSMNNNASKYFVKDYYLKACLCWMALDDIVGAKRAFNDYEASDASFSAQREYVFILKLLDAIDSSDLEKFTNIVVEFDSTSRLDQLKTTLLLRAKRHLLKVDEETLVETRKMSSDSTIKGENADANDSISLRSTNNEEKSVNDTDEELL